MEKHEFQTLAIRTPPAAFCSPFRDGRYKNCRITKDLKNMGQTDTHVGQTDTHLGQTDPQMGQTDTHMGQTDTHGL